MLGMQPIGKLHRNTVVADAPQPMAQAACDSRDNVSRSGLHHSQRVLDHDLNLSGDRSTFAFS